MILQALKNMYPRYVPLPKKWGAINKEHGGGEIRRRVHIIRLKKDKIYGIIKYLK